MNYIYLFCCVYHFNHYIKKNKDISKYLCFYRDILDNPALCAKDFKYFYRTYKEKALYMLEENIKYCEKRL